MTYVYTYLTFFFSIIECEISISRRINDKLYSQII